MIDIIINGESLDLPEDFSIEIEDTNPAFNDRGSQSVPVTVTTTRRNTRLLCAPHRIDAGVDPNLPERSALILAGGYTRRGTLNIAEAGRRDGITFNIGFDNSTAYQAWTSKKLSGLSHLPVMTIPPDGKRSSVKLLLDHLYGIYRDPLPGNDDLAIFPLAIGKTTPDGQEGQIAKVYWEILNVPGNDGFTQPAKVNRVIDGVVTEVNVPEAYCVSPFLRVWRVLELIFGDLGLEIEENPFRDDKELSMLVVLNNAADACCTGHLRYADLLPDVTVEEFLNSLWVRFGLVYYISDTAGTVTMRLMKDIITAKSAGTLDPNAADFEKIIYEKSRYLKLSAKTSLEGAAPATERFEDFSKGLDVKNIKMGNDVSLWAKIGTSPEAKWDGEIYDDYYNDYDDGRDDWVDPEPPEPDYPDPDPDDWDDDRDDDRDDRDPAERPADSTDGTVEEVSYGGAFLAREFLTGMWYWLDACNGKTVEKSTSFFNWDPQPDGLEPLELQSDDECVPVGRVSNAGTGTAGLFNGKAPLYLTGSRHYHSYIRGNDTTGEKSSGESGIGTPLAFMFAYDVGKKTIGRLNGEDENGNCLILANGSRPRYSLLFQFSDGLFSHFWRKYDEILRHGNRKVEIPARVNKNALFAFNLLDIYSFKGIRCLIDKMNYSLPSGRLVATDITLRTMQTQGEYDIKAEQNIPNFAAAARHLEWKRKSETYGENLDSKKNRAEALEWYIQNRGYTPVNTDTVTRSLTTEGMILTRMKREMDLEAPWKWDRQLGEPSYYRQTVKRPYYAYLFYDLYETITTKEGDTTRTELSETPVGHFQWDVEYEIELIAVWVSDSPLDS